MNLKPSDIKKIETFLEKIKGDTYPEPPTERHTQLTYKLFDYFTRHFSLVPPAKILDIGCGQGVALELFTERGFSTIGITLNSEDVAICQKKGYEVYEMDQSFLDFADNEFDFVWCRHCLEHSIFPYFTLAEIFRVLKSPAYLYIEVPAPDTNSNHQFNRNHYSVLGKTMWLSLIERAGFENLDVVDIKFPTMLGIETYWAFIQKKP